MEATVFTVLPAALPSKSLKKAVGKEQMYKVFMDLHGKTLFFFLLRNVKTWTGHFCNARGWWDILNMRSWSHGTQDLHIAEKSSKPQRTDQIGWK